MLSTMSVPAASIIGMICTLLISTVVPIAAFIIAAVKWKGRVRISSFFIGAATFIVFAMILERILHTVVFRATGTLFTDNIWLYAIYGGLAAGLFEETGRFLAMKFCMKNTLSRENALLYGIGHGGTEAILLIGLTYINNLLYSVLINSGSLTSMLAPYDADTRQTLLLQLSALGTTPSIHFYLAGLERIGAMLLHVVLSYLVYLAVKNSAPKYYALAVFLHAFLNAAIVILSSKISVVLTEIAFIIVILLLAFLIYRHEKGRDEAGTQS